MKKISARQAKNEFGALLHAAQLEPVMVTRHDRPVVVVTSASAFAALPKHAVEMAEASVEPMSKKGFDAYFGSLRGVWGNTPEEIDAYVRAERDSWE